LGTNSNEISLNSGKIDAKQRKIVQNGWQAVSAMLMERLSRQYHDIFLEYLGI
jgi:phosphoribosylformimino-5-aminoimidazole carboxamide ribonucleotide (ProFAR) isomerase